MQKIKPVGQRLIVFPLPDEETITDANIVVMDMQLTKGELVGVSDELKDVYSVGDTVIFPKETGLSIHYKKKSCLWLNNQTDIWGIVTEDKE